MRATWRRVYTGVIQGLLAQPHRFSFFQAVRLWELYFRQRDKTRLKEIIPARLQFKNSLKLSFPASEIEQLSVLDAEGQNLATVEQQETALNDNSLASVQLTPSFLGLLGPLGALPRHYTEKIAERESHFRDHAARAFMDTYSNRATALFYQAWKKYRLPLHYELDRNERFLPLLMSLAGVTVNDGELQEESLAHYAAALRHRPVSALYLQQILSDYFKVPIRLEQFVGHWYEVPLDQRTRLGRTHAILGKTALCGAYVWQRNLRIRLWIGPLNRTQFEQFLPVGKACAALRQCLNIMTGNTLEYEIKPILHREHVHSATLGRSNIPARLGWDAFISTRPTQQHREDVSYTLLNAD